MSYSCLLIIFLCDIQYKIKQNRKMKAAQAAVEELWVKCCSIINYSAILPRLPLYPTSDVLLHSVKSCTCYRAVVIASWYPRQSNIS